MPQRIRSIAKEALTKYGPDNDRLDILLHMPKLRTWQREHFRSGQPTFARRSDLYDHLCRTVISGDAVDFLEFGVYEGESVRCWTGLNQHPDSRFVGFDTFEGLPEDWTYFGGTIERSTFDLGGSLPDVDDQRVSFVKGMFQDTLRPFLADFEPRSQLVVHCDADLYSSTLYVLTQCDHIMAPGTIVIFDEFAAVLHEFEALRNYCAAYGRTYDVLGATEGLAHVAVQMR